MLAMGQSGDRARQHAPVRKKERKCKHELKYANLRLRQQMLTIARVVQPLIEEDVSNKTEKL